ncbi:MAG: isochorismatase family protein [Myxococcales bacterium]|nr:isochorismatase family protein [Myxococcales bacterium]
MDALTLDPAHTALVVVDIQEKLAPAMPSGDYERLLKATHLLVETARLLGMSTFATEQYPQGLGPTVQSLREAFAGFPTVVVPSEKTVFSAATPAVLEALHRAHVRRVLVVGLEAHVCVFQTVRDLLGRGFGVHVPHDAVASRDPKNRDVALATLRAHGAAVTSAETAVFDLLHDAKHPHFRALSKLVKAL